MSVRPVVLALARLEGRRLLRHPFILAAAALLSVVFVLLLTGDDTEAEYGWWLFVPYFPFPAAVLVAVNLAALRERRDGTAEMYDSLPTPAPARTAAHLVSLAWAVAAAAALVAIGVIVFMSKGNPLPNVAQATTTPALVLVCGALGLALARWLPHPAVATAGVVGLFALGNVVFALGESIASVVVVGFVGLAVLCGALALLRDRSRLA